MVDHGPFVLTLLSTPRTVGYTIKVAEGIWVMNTHQSHERRRFWGGTALRNFKPLGRDCKTKLACFMICCIFTLTGLFLFRETSFQQVLLSSSGPKENISTSNFIYPWGCIRKCFPKYFAYNILQFIKFLYIRLMLLSYIVTDVKSPYLLSIGRCYCHFDKR